MKIGCCPRQHEANSDPNVPSECGVSPKKLACVYAWRGDENASFEWLERAYRIRQNELAYIKFDARSIGSLHDDPRYLALLRK